MSADKEKLEFYGEDEICAAKGKEAVLGVVLAAQRRILACGISGPEGRTIAAQEKVGVLDLLKVKETPQ
jgi:hypothetical protein